MPEARDISLDKRRDTIEKRVNTEGKVKVSVLAKHFGISEVTIRNDLKDMEQEGLLQRVHGGAVSNRKSYYDMDLTDRLNINQNQKIAIAKAVSEMVSDGDSVMIDSGSTNYYVAKELAAKKNLTIVTNSLQIAQTFIHSPSINVILLGGNLYLPYQFTYGSDTIAQLQKYKADKMILAINGISAEHGLTTYHYQEVEVTKSMIDRSKEVIVVADTSKIGTEGFTYISSLKEVDVLVTCQEKDQNQALDAIRAGGITVRTVPFTPA